METITVEACPTCRRQWSVGSPAACAEPDHDHRRLELHDHLDDVTLRDGTTITAASWIGRPPYDRKDPPDVGLYLDAAWSPPWTHTHLAWPDFGAPADPTETAAALTDLLAAARSGRRTEIGCLGGHGRTGTALACLAILAGTPAVDALQWVRQSYCPSAVETADQERFVADFRP